MQSHRITIKPLTAFGGALHGDTLFGQLCWNILRASGQQRLEQLLDGYTAGRPFAVLSDAFPAGYLPRPALPLYRYHKIADSDRKQARKRCWLPEIHAVQPIEEWLALCASEADLLTALTNNAGDPHATLTKVRPQPHNTINRHTDTTGTGDFAPYTQSQIWHAAGIELDIHVVLDEQRMAVDELRQRLDELGQTGYGRDASIGLGKFEIRSMSAQQPPPTDRPNCCLALAPVAPQGLSFDSQRSWYQPFTRFGRHGDQAVHRAGGPFKNPLLLAATGGLYTLPNTALPPFIGQGLGGDGSISQTIPETVHQGYAPVLHLHLEGHHGH